MGSMVGRVRRVTVCSVVCGALLLGACSSDPGNGSADRKVMDLNKDGAGTCLLMPDKVDPEVSKLPVIDCALEHTHEIYKSIAVTDGEFPVYPGTEALGAKAQHDCTAAFEPYVGSAPFDSDLFFSWLLPTLTSWNDFEDRTILCVASRFDDGKLTGTIHQSGM